jgi:hypothetical protein
MLTLHEGTQCDTDTDVARVTGCWEEDVVVKCCKVASGTRLRC